MFHVARRKAGLAGDGPELSTAAFRRPEGSQLKLGFQGFQPCGVRSSAIKESCSSLLQVATPAGCNTGCQHRLYTEREVD
jgi:hypothetical protein